MDNSWNLWYACINNNTEDINKLISSSLDSELIHSNNDQALRFACLYSTFETVKLLISLGADIHASNECSLIFACSRDYNNNDDDIDTGTKSDTEPESDHIKIVRILLDLGANVHVEKERPLLIASSFGSFKLINLLLEYGSRPNSKILDIASARGSLYIVQLLLKNGANVTTTSIQWSCKQKDVNKLLLCELISKNLIKKYVKIYLSEFLFDDMTNLISTYLV